MSNIKHYSEKLSVIQSIKDDKIQPARGIPVSIYIQEAENLYNWCQPDREKLTANGLDWSLVDDMPARIDTLREAQSRWVTSDSNNIDIEREWDIKSPAAHAFRKELLRSLKFAFRNNPSALAKIKKFGEGDSNVAMIQSIRDISVFGTEHAGFLKTSRFDVTLLETAEAMSRELAALLGAVNSRRAFCSDILKIRNQAYTHLKEAVTELKNHANFVLWREPARIRGYASVYMRRKYLKKRGIATQSPAENTAE